MRLLTSAEVEEIARGQRGTDHQILAEQHIAACQALADSPCPVCMVTADMPQPGRVQVFPDGPMERWRMKPCPHCGDYPDDRKGKAFRDWREACDSLGEKTS